MKKSNHISLKIVLFSIILLVFSACKKTADITDDERKFLSENKDIVVGLFINYPPFEFINDAGKIDGIMIDYFMLLEDKINHKFKKKYYDDWQQLINDVKNNKIDIILEIQKTTDRENFLIFTEPILVGNHNIINKKGTKYSSLKELKDKRVAVCNDFAIQEYLKQKHPEINTIGFTDEREALNALSNNEVDAFVGLESTTNYVITKHGIKNIFIGKSLKYNNKLGIGITKSKPILANVIIKGNQAITFEEKEAIFKKWLFSLNTPLQNKVSFWKILMVMVSVLLVSFLATTVILKNKVNLRTKLLNYAKSEAEKSSELKSLFLHNISKELKTPLQTVKTFASKLQSDIGTLANEKQLKELSIQSNNLTTLLNNIVNISELTNKKIKLKPNIINIKNEINLIAEIYKNKAEQKNTNLIFTANIPEDNQLIFIDTIKLNTCITALLDHFIQVSKNSHIKLNASVYKNNLLIQIANTSSIYSIEKINYFLNETQIKNHEIFKHYNNKFIGLSIANRTTEALDGTIKIEENEDSGITFKVNIPIKKAVSKSNVKTKSLDEKLQILITEDMKLNYLVLKKSIEKTLDIAPKITWATNGKQAVDLVENQNFDLIFMDIKMPVLNGFDAAKQIKQKHPNIKIIAQTAYTQEDDIYKAKSIGFDGYLTKPIDINVLKANLKGLHFIN